MKITVFLTHHEVPCWNFSPENLRKLKAKIPGAEIVVCADKDEFITQLPGTDICLIWYFNEQWLEQADKLNWIVTPAAGRDYFHVEPERGITIDYGSFHGRIMGETVLGMMLAEVRGIRATLEFQQAGEKWRVAKIIKNMVNLRGSRITILGFGNIGQWVARLAKPFDVQITGVKRNQIPAPSFFTTGDRVITIQELDSVLPYTDHLVITLPSGADTDDILNEKRIQLLPFRAVIYNVGRGNAIDEKALYKALQTDKIAAAYLDVFKQEPLPENSPLRKCKNLCIMPHVSAIAPNYLDFFVDEFIEKYKKKFESFY